MKREYLYGMLVIGLLVIIAAGSYYYFLPRNADEDVTATLLVFSGRPDPVWQISGQKDLQTLKGLLKDIPAAENPNWKSILGYRGIALEPVYNESLGISGKIVAWNGIIEFNHDGEYVYYTDVHGLEDWLKEKARAEGLEDLIAAFQIPNPASVYCEQHGGRSQIRTDPDGNQYGVCIFPNGSECEEWAFFRGECQPGNASPIGMPNPASVYCEQHGGRLEIRADASGGQYGVCVFPDGSECEEWAFFRGECKPGEFSYSVSGCLKDSGRGAGNVEIEIIGNMVNIKHHLNYVCCAKIELQMGILESYPPIFRITEKNGGEMCKCVCDYDVEARIGPLGPGIYVIQIWGVEFRETPASLIFEKRIEIESKNDFCGYSTHGTCSSDADCMTGGCSGQVCQSRFEDSVITTCEWRECYDAKKYGYGCKCISGKCQWVKNGKIKMI